MTTNNTETMALITARLEAAFSPSHLQVIDESHLHAGHAGQVPGRGHYALVIVSDAFADLPLLKRHQLIYAELADLMQTRIHALSIQARAK